MFFYIREAQANPLKDGCICSCSLLMWARLYVSLSNLIWKAIQWSKSGQHGVFQPQQPKPVVSRLEKSTTLRLGELHIVRIVRSQLKLIFILKTFVRLIQKILMLMISLSFHVDGFLGWEAG